MVSREGKAQAGEGNGALGTPSDEEEIQDWGEAPGANPDGETENWGEGGPVSEPTSEPFGS